MARSPLSFLRSPDGHTIFDDLREGRAGAWTRGGLSVAALPLVLAPVMFAFAIHEASAGRIPDHYIAIGLGLAGAAWCGTLLWLWAGYRRWRRFIRTTLAIVGVWALIIPACVFFAQFRRAGPFLITGSLFTGLSITIVIVVHSTYRGAQIAPVRDLAGRVRVACPQCGYSMVGLETCTCPECGAAFTINQIIAAQDYARRALEPAEEDDPEPVVGIDPSPRAVALRTEPAPLLAPHEHESP